MFHPQLTPLPFRESVHPIVRVDSIAKILRSKILPSEISNVEVFHYSIPNVQQVGNGKVEPGESIDSDKWLLTEEAVLISKLNPRKSTICVASKHKLTTVFSTEFVGLSTGNTIDNKYLKYVLDSEPVRQFLSSRTTSATRSHQRVTPHEITALGIPWPDSQIRLLIVRELDRELAEIDEFIADQTHLQELLDEHRLSFIDDVLNPYWESTIALKHLGSLSSGITLGAKYTEETETYPYLRVANVQAGKLDLSEIKEASVPESVAKQNLLRAGDVLMTEGGDRDKLGRGALWNGEITPMLHQNHVFAFRCNPQKLLPEFLVYCLESSLVRSYFETTAKQSTNLATTNSTIVKNCHIPNIDIITQQSIINRINQALTNNLTTRNDLKDLRSISTNRKKSLIRKHFIA